MNFEAAAQKCNRKPSALSDSSNSLDENCSEGMDSPKYKFSMPNLKCELNTMLGPEPTEIFTFNEVVLPHNMNQGEKDTHILLDTLGLNKVNIENYLHDRKKTMFTSPARIKNEMEEEAKSKACMSDKTSPFNLLVVKSPSFIQRRFKNNLP